MLVDKKTFCLSISLIIVIISIILIIFPKKIFNRSDSISLNTPYGKTFISKDNHGIPHISSKTSDLATFYALGYVHAKDRFWQMEFQRRVGQGTLSEIFGNKTLEADKLLRIFGFYRASETAWLSLDKQSKAILESYAEGVNYFLDHNALPLQIKILRYKPKPWTVIDSIVWEKLMAFDLQNTWLYKINNYLIANKYGNKEINVIYPPYPQNGPTILQNVDLVQSNPFTKNASINSKIKITPNLADNLWQTSQIANTVSALLGYPHETDKGSNNWVLSGKFTTTGKPILANDPHLALSAPTLWYLAELRGPSLHATGGTIPGVPSVIIGHNDYIAWGVTNVDPDVQDLYIEPSNVKLNSRIENIGIRNKPNLEYIVKESIHGPIINAVIDSFKVDYFSTPVALKWTALQPRDTTMASFIKINFAQNWQEFTDALHYFIVPSQNFVYADIKGNIGYFMSGKIPIRKGWDGTLPIQASQNNEWSGYIPFAELPHVYNPKSGFIVTANNKVVPDSYPYKITFRWHNPPYRSERILELIKHKSKLNIEDNQLIQTDTKSTMWQDFKPILLKTIPQDDFDKMSLELLAKWDGYMHINSNSASIFAVWYAKLDLAMHQNLKLTMNKFNPLFIKNQLKINGKYCNTNHATNCAKLLSYTLHETTDFLRKKLGNNPKNWTWGKIHIAEFSESGLGKSKLIGWLWSKQTSTPGGEDTVDVGTYDEQTFFQTNGATYRQIIDLSNFNNSVYIEPLGQSENLFHLHYADLLPLWVSGKYIKINYNYDH